MRKLQRIPKQRVWTKDYLEISRKNLLDNDFLPILFNFLSIEKVSKVLDIGTGLGYIAQLLYSTKKTIDITGIDINNKLISFATKESLIKKQNIKYNVMDAYSLIFPDALYDLVIEQTVLVNVPRPHDVLKEMIRVAKQGGLIVAIEPIVQYDHHNMYWPDEESPAVIEEDALYDLIMRKIIQYRKKHDIDEFIAPKLPGIFKTHGLLCIESKMTGKVIRGSPFPDDQKLKEHLRKELREQEKGNSYILKEAITAGVSREMILKKRGMTIKRLRKSLKYFDETVQLWNERVICQNLLITKGIKP